MRNPVRIGLSFWVAQDIILCLIIGYAIWGLGCFAGFFSAGSRQQVFPIAMISGFIVGFIDFIFFGKS